MIEHILEVLSLFILETIDAWGYWGIFVFFLNSYFQALPAATD